MMKPLSSTIQQVINFTWPMVIISVVIMVSFRIAYLIRNKEKFVLCFFFHYLFDHDVSRHGICLK